MNFTFRFLHIEDDSLDEEIIQIIIKSYFQNVFIKTVKTKNDFIKELKKRRYDIILSDFNLPSFDGRTALKIFNEKKLNIPFIFITGEIDKNKIIDTAKEGATDYIFKDNLKELIPAIKKALTEFKKIKCKIKKK